MRLKNVQIDHAERLSFQVLGADARGRLELRITALQPFADFLQFHGQLVQSDLRFGLCHFEHALGDAIAGLWRHEVIDERAEAVVALEDLVVVLVPEDGAQERERRPGRRLAIPKRRAMRETPLLDYYYCTTVM